MAIRKKGKAIIFLENIVSNPIKATIIVGLSILALLQLVDYLSQYFPAITYMKYAAPFIPPFVITNTSRSIVRQRSEHYFVKEAEPYIFIAYPKSLSVEDMLDVKPVMVSDSASGHLNMDIDLILDRPVLPELKLADPRARKQIVETLIADFKKNQRYGKVSGFKIYLLPFENEQPLLYIMNSVLTENSGRLKWQATLVQCNKDCAGQTKI